MHELSLLTSVIETAVSNAHGREITAIGLRIGARSGVIVEAVQAAWPIAQASFPQCMHAELVITFLPATVYCPQCATCHEIDEFFALMCPVCATPTADLRSGTEFRLEWVDVHADSDCSDSKAPDH